MKRSYWVLVLVMAVVTIQPVGAAEREWSPAAHNRRLSQQFGVTIEGGPTEGFREMRYQVSANRKLSVEDSRKLVIDLARAICDGINADHTLKDQLPEQPYLVQRVSILLTSEPAHKDRTGEDVAYLMMGNGVIQYFRTERGDEARSLYEISAETWDDAVAYVETGKMADPLCLGQWIVIDPADGSLDKGLESPEVAEALGAVLQQISESYPEAELSVLGASAARVPTEAEYEAYYARGMLELHRQWGDFFTQGGSSPMYVQNAHRDGIEISRRALERYFPPLRRKIVIFAIDPTSYVPPETCLEGSYYMSDGNIERSQDRTLILEDAFESGTFDRFGRREMQRLINEAEGKQ